MQGAPLLEPVEGILILQDQVVGYGQNLPVGLREAPLQVLGDAQLLSDGVEEPGRTAEEPRGPGGRNRAWFGRSLPGSFLSSSAVGGTNLAGFFIDPADQGPLRS